MEYNFREIEQKWQRAWKAAQVYKVAYTSDKPKCYVLDMFPYPSGAGLHVGHPLGYIASDIYSRHKRLKGFNVLHPMGFDSFGLPAEQYALETGQHPAETTRKNIENYKSQLEKIGFSYDWSREVQTSDPAYYRWTQWIFLQLFNSYFCNTQKKARPIADLIGKYETKGSKHFTAEEWKNFSEPVKSDWLMKRRLAFSSYGEVNWCEALGTVLANDEVVNGVSERGGFPVVKKKMRQWYLRITAYADRLLQGLETVNFSEAMKEMQRNWIGRSEGAEIDFAIASSANIDHSNRLKVYTTRPDTIFGVDFMVLAPEHELVDKITTADQKTAIEEYLQYVKSRSERERMAEVKQITGAFTGAYAINPFDGRQIPIWIAEYVLAGYGTGAIMAVPCGDQRDFLFAKHFNIPITNIIGDYYNGEEANPTKEAILQNSGFLNGLKMSDAIGVAIQKLEEMKMGVRKVNFKMRDAGFSRQRYWGEPFPIIWKDEVPYPLNESELPLTLPHVEKYGPGPEGEGPLANISEWINTNFKEEKDGSVITTGVNDDEKKGIRESSTMPGYAGSSWYFLRYMDPHNKETFCNKTVSDYWNQVDMYVGGTEHAVGHLLYSRMWTKFLFDRGWISFDEPFKKLVNQGMIQGSSRFVYRVTGTNQFVSAGLKDSSPVHALHVDVNMVDGIELDLEKFKKWKTDYANAEFILEDGVYICGTEVEKMSKSKYNTVSPDELCERYGADTFRMYEMFLGPIEQSKPWDTKGIEGVHRFLKKLWRLFYAEKTINNSTEYQQAWNNEPASTAALKVLHRTIKKIDSDSESFSYNTAVSAFMVCVNELTELKCYSVEVLEPLLIILSPYAPHITQELYSAIHKDEQKFIVDAAFPLVNETLLVESSKEYPISINGKLRTTLVLPLDADQASIEQAVLANDVVVKWLDGKPHKKIIYVKGKMVNVVI